MLSRLPIAPAPSLGAGQKRFSRICRLKCSVLTNINHIASHTHSFSCVRLSRHSVMIASVVPEPSGTCLGRQRQEDFWEGRVWPWRCPTRAAAGTSSTAFLQPKGTPDFLQNQNYLGPTPGAVRKGRRAQTGQGKRWGVTPLCRSGLRHAPNARSDPKTSLKTGVGERARSDPQAPGGLSLPGAAEPTRDHCWSHQFAQATLPLRPLYKRRIQRASRKPGENKRCTF